MERAALFLDVANTELAFRRYNSRVDYLGLREYIADGRSLVEAFAYVPMNPRHPERKRNFIDFLRRNGFWVRSKVGKPRPQNKWKCAFDIEMTLDMLRYARHARIDILVLGSGDGDMTPVLQELRMNGVRCEVASTRESIAEDLLGVASGFIDLGKIIVAQSQERSGDAMDADGHSGDPNIDFRVNAEE
jgi:uncharacterized LabA/DUF88 family protein